MSGEKTENEKLGGVLLNGIGSHESPGVGVSGSRPLVNGDLRDGDSESEYGRGKSAVLTDSASEGGSSSAGKQGDVVVKVNSAYVNNISCDCGTESCMPGVRSARLKVVLRMSCE